MEVKRGYKQTEVGVIPEDWDVKPLRSVLLKARLGGNYPNQSAETKFPLMKMGNLGRGKFNISKIEYIESGIQPDKAHRLFFGDVVFNTRNTLDLVGKVAMWRDELPVAFYNSNLMRLEFDPEEICSNDFANAALNTEASLAKLRALATGTTSVAAIYTRDLMEMCVAVPPKTEQRAIGGGLSDTDALLDGLDRLIAKKRAIKQTVMQQLLTGQIRLPGFSGDWDATQLGDCVSIRNQKVLPVNVAPQTLCVELEHVGQGDGRLLVKGEAKNSSAVKYRFHVGDVLFGRLRSYLRKYWLAAEDGICTTEIWPLVVDLEKINSRFLFALVQTDSFIEAASISYGTHMPRADWSVVRKHEVHLPSKEEQTAIVTILDGLDTEITALEIRRIKTCALKQAVVQELLTGRTRLV